MADYDNFKKYEVQVSCLNKFLSSFYKPERYTGRGNVYAKNLFASYQKNLNDFGFVFISPHDSIIGQVVSYYKPLDKDVLDLILKDFSFLLKNNESYTFPDLADIIILSYDSSNPKISIILDTLNNSPFLSLVKDRNGISSIKPVPIVYPDKEV